MSNINRDYLITVDVKKATVKSSGMSFYITDVKTSNIFCQLVINESKSELVEKYAAVENASDFRILLRIIKPNNEPKELYFTLLDEEKAFFMIDLEDDCKDYIGEYTCELFVDCIVNEELERITTASFTYEVAASIMNDLDDVIEGDSDYPLVDEILEQLKTVDPSQFATTKYVDESIANIDIPEVDFTGYATTESVNKALETKADKDHTHDEYATTEYVGNKYVSNGALEQTLSDYATVQYVGDKYASKAMLEEYATIKYVDEAISSVSGGSGADLSAYATKEDLNKAITVIDKNSIGFDDFPKGKSVCRLNGALEIRDINGNSLTSVGECYQELIMASKLDDDTHKSITIYTLDNRCIRCDIKNGTVYRYTYDVTKDYVDSKVASCATKQELNTALGDIETLLGGI